MDIRDLSKEFFNSEKAGGLILIFVTAISMVLANSTFGGVYSSFWNFEFANHTLVQWINDGLMAIFFLLIGLELEREIYMGELTGLKKASLPIFAALGGMLVPALLFLLFNFGSPTQSGFGIPMATDIAFAIGILSLLGSRVPISLKIFLTALAVIDDLGAIIIIAIFYTAELNWNYLLIALLIYLSLFGLKRLKVYNLIPYLLGGVAMWYFMLYSGVHATITGVLLAFAIPLGSGGDDSPSYRLQHYLHRPVAFFILPIFAAANTLIIFDDKFIQAFSSYETIGVLAGLVIGKPLGIWLFSFIAVSIGLAVLPKSINWKNVIGVGLLGGIGFTMSIFITLLAFDDLAVINNSKIAILTASLVAGAAGFIILSKTLPEKVDNS